MSYILNLDLYWPQLNSNNPDIIKNSFQVMYENFTRNFSLSKKDSKRFIPILEKHINSRYPKVRKWAYHCACFYTSQKIITRCKKQLGKETNSENILWNISALAYSCRNLYELKGLIPDDLYEKFRYQLSPNFLIIASLMSSRIADETLCVRSFADSDNKSELMALTKLYGYPNLAQKCLISQDVIISLRQHDDQDIREYSLWSLFKSNQLINYSVAETKLDDVPSVSKWAHAVYISGGDEELITDKLEQINNPKLVNPQVKEGIILGLSRVGYHKKFVHHLIRWYPNEDNRLIEQLLLQYMVDHCIENYEDNDRSFYETINEELHDISNLNKHTWLVQLIRNNPNTLYSLSEHEDALVISKDRTRIYNVFDKGVVQAMENEDNKQHATYTFNAPITNAVFEPHGPVVINSRSYDTNELSTLLEKLINETSDSEVKSEAESILQDIKLGKKVSEEKFKSFLSILANAATVVSATPMFVQIANSVYNLIKNLF